MTPEFEKLVNDTVHTMQEDPEVRVIGGKLITAFGGDLTTIVGFTLFTTKNDVFDGYVNFDMEGYGVQSSAAWPCGVNVEADRIEAANKQHDAVFGHDDAGLNNPAT